MVNGSKPWYARRCIVGFFDVLMVGVLPRFLFLKSAPMADFIVEKLVLK